MKQYISFGPSAGICNRIKRLFSAMRFNVNWDEPLDFYWSQGELTNHSFYELFQFDLYEFNEIPCSVKIFREDEFDVAAQISWRLDIKDGEVPVGFTQAFPKDNMSKEYIDFEYNRIPEFVRKEYMRYFDALRPSAVVQKRIDSVRIPENCVSVHIRQGRYWNEYNRGTRDSVDAYIEEMGRYPKDTYFFLAAADENGAIKVKKAFPDRIIELPDKDFADSIDAVAELYLLGKTNTLIATYGSTFSEVAWWLGEGKQQVVVIGTEKEWKVKCPICKGTSKIIKNYTRNECLKMYRHLYQSVPADLEVVDYEIRQCDACKLVFANPMKAGSQSFYTWVTGHDNYYPTVNSPRWEWGEIKSYVRDNNVSTLLEVGCGTGEFLEYLRLDTKVEAVGLDTTTSSYDVCISKGLKAYNESLEKYILGHTEKYDLVVAFHLLEHVEDPLNLVTDMMKLLNNGGKCMLSFPYSDTRLDKCFTTANNMPPHHVTRWELPAIKALAEAVNANLEIVAPEASTVEEDTWSDLRNEYFPIYNNAHISKNKIRWEALKHFSRTKEIKEAQKTRTNIEIAAHIGAKPIERRPPWFVLIVLSKKKQ